MSAQPRVVIWRDIWLPRSETFIRDQTDAMRRWEPVPLGLKRASEGLPVNPAFAPLPTWWPSDAIRALGSRGLERAATRAVRRSGAVLIHAHFGPSAVHVLPIARASGLPLIATFHGYDVTRTPDLPFGQGTYYRRRLERVFDYADRLLAVSQFIAERVLALGAPEYKVAVQHVGIPIRDSSSGTDRTGITFVGRLVDKKGVKDLLEAYALLPEPLRSSTPLRVVGMGPLEQRLRGYAEELGVEVQWLGYQTSEQVAGILAATRVFCAPSRQSHDGNSEGFGMVFLEAALHGAPIVTYRHGGVPEAVLDGVTGLLAQEGDTRGLARRIEHLLTDDGLARRLGDAGRRRVNEQFDIQVCTSSLEDTYDKVMGER